MCLHPGQMAWHPLIAISDPFPLPWNPLHRPCMRWNSLVGGMWRRGRRLAIWPLIRNELGMGRATNGWQSHSSDKKRRHGEQARQMFQHNVSLLLQKALRRSAPCCPHKAVIRRSCGGKRFSAALCNNSLAAPRSWLRLLKTVNNFSYKICHGSHFGTDHSSRGK